MLKKERILILLIALGLINARVEAVNYTTPLTGASISLTGADTVDVSGTSYAISVTTGGVGLKINGAPVIRYTSSTVSRILPDASSFPSSLSACQYIIPVVL